MKSRESLAIPTRSTIIVVFILMASTALFFGWQERAESRSARDEKKEAPTDRPVTIRAEKRGFPNVSLADGTDLGVPAEQLNGEQPTHLISADFDSDGIADLVTADISGKLRLYKGNGGSGNNKALDPFELTSKVFSLGFPADYLTAGDFNADGQEDILAAARGGSILALLPGNGRGGLAAAQTIKLSGNITAFATGEIGQADGQTDVAVAVTNSKGSFLLVFEHPESAFKHDPEMFRLPAPANDIALGNLDADFFSDITVACGNTLVIVHGRGQAYPWDIVKGVDIKRPAAVVATRLMPFNIAGLAVGGFSEERGNSLALLSDSGSIYRLQPTKPKTFNLKVSKAEISKGTATEFLPTGVNSGNRRLAARPAPSAFAADGSAMYDRSLSHQENIDLGLKQLEDADLKLAMLGKDERARQKAGAMEQNLIHRERAKAAFLRTISAQPSTLAAWRLDALVSDGRLQAANSPGAKKLIVARVSTSGLDDLVMLDSASRQVQIVTQPKTDGRRMRAEVDSLDVEGTPYGAVPMRLNHDAMDDLVVVRAGASVPSIALTAPTSVITVNDSGDGVSNCVIGPTCTLRNAIQLAKDNPGTTIAFNIPGAGVHTISPTSELPVITGNGTVIDGSTQPGFAGLPLIEIKGNQIGGAADGLKVRASNCQVLFLAINEFPFTNDGQSTHGGNGITLESLAGTPVNGHNFIAGNFLGTDPTGMIAKGGAVGLLAFTSDNNFIDGNLLSGNSGYGFDVTGGNNNVIVSNYVGLAIDGITALGNTNGVFLTGANNQFGGDGGGQGNKVSGNGVPIPGGFPPCRGGIGIGIPVLFDVATGDLLTQLNLLKGNKIGTSADGTQAVGNCTQGIVTDALAETVIGSIAPNGRNTVSGNGYDAIYCEDFIGSLSGTPSDGGFCSIIGNNIGTNSAGSAAIPNDHRDESSGLHPLSGIITIVNGNTLSNFGAPGGTTPGGSCTGFCNLISGNAGGDGIQLNGYGTMGVFNSYIGTDITGTQSLQNPFGTPAIFPAAVSADIFIGGLGAQFGVPDTSLGNLISGNTFALVGGGSGTLTIESNLVGTDAQGINAVPNGCTGCGGASISIANSGLVSLQIGDTDPLARNVISGNALDGITLQQNPYTDVTIVNNAIGVNSVGDPLPNTGAGISFFDLGGATIGGSSGEEQNLIQNNGHAGILVLAHVPGGQPSYPSGVNIQGNHIKNNGGLGIDLSAGTTDDGVTINDCGDTDSGPNELQNYPVLAAPIVNGDGTLAVNASLSSEPLETYRIDFYSSGQADPTNFGEGENYIGSKTVETNADGLVVFTFVSALAVPSGSTITSTATNENNSTSEFSCAAGACTGGSAILPESPTVGCSGSIVVNSTGDAPDLGTDFCSTGGMVGDQPECTLRAAMQQVIAHGPEGHKHLIGFAIPGTGVKTISPSSPLPTISVSMDIVGSTQAANGQEGVHLIEINGANAGAAHGLALVSGGDGSIIRELTINHFQGAGIALVDANLVRITGCYLGLNSDGVSVDPAGTQSSGILLSGASRAQIGGVSPFEINVISGNQTGIAITGGSGNSVLNNKIGTDKDGTGLTSSGNAVSGNDNGVVITGSVGNKIGEELPGVPNIISGNAQNGLMITGNSSKNVITGNFVGTDASGGAAVANGQNGIVINSGSADNTIGGAANNGFVPNLIAGNDKTAASAGILIDTDAGANNAMYGNLLGSNLAQDHAIPNKTGIIVSAGSTKIGQANIANTIHASSKAGIWIRPADGHTMAATVIQANYIGTNADDTSLQNSVGILASGDGTGVQIVKNMLESNPIGIQIGGNINAVNYTVGGSDLASANTVVKGSDGISIVAGSSTNNINFNYIGTDSGQLPGKGNKVGIRLYGSGNTVSGNVISSNIDAGQSGAGIFLGRGSGGAPQGNQVTNNKVGTDSSGASPLPNDTGIILSDGANGNFIGDSAGTVNVISGNRATGVMLTSKFNADGNTSPVTGNVVNENVIGTDVTGTYAIPNQYGVKVARGTVNNQIGGTHFAFPSEGNLISGNTLDGIYLGRDDGTGNNPVQNHILGNNIGLNKGGRDSLEDASIPNMGNGIRITDGANGNVIGETSLGNIISGNIGSGILITTQDGLFDNPPFGNIIQANRIGLNGYDAALLRKPFGNNNMGIEIFNSADNIIGDAARIDPSEPSSGNTICANIETGISIISDSSLSAMRTKVIGNTIGLVNDPARQFGNKTGIHAEQAPGTEIYQNTINGSTLKGITLKNEIFNARHTKVAGEGPPADIEGNLIGVGIASDGSIVPAGNGTGGIEILNSAGVQISALTLPSGDAVKNIVSGNGGPGITIDGAGSQNNSITGALIGTDQNGDELGNGGDGVLISDSASFNLIGGPGPGAGNSIVFNIGSGVDLDATAGTGNLIDPNSIAGNGKLGIDLGGTGVPVPNDAGDEDTGPNNLQNYPNIASHSIDASGDLIVTYSVDSDPGNSNYGTVGLRVEFFKADIRGQGSQFLGFDNYTVGDHDGSRIIAAGKTVNLGNAANLGVVSSDKITGTVTDADGNTSEFFPVALVPTAANVSVSGRVLTADGRGLPNAVVSISGHSGVTRTVRTGSFGYYRFEDVLAGETYVISVAAKGYSFAPRFLQVTDTLSDVDLVGDEM